MVARFVDYSFSGFIQLQLIDRLFPQKRLNEVFSTCYKVSVVRNLKILNSSSIFLPSPASEAFSSSHSQLPCH